MTLWLDILRLKTEACTELQRVADSAIIIDKEAVASIFTHEAVAEAQRRYENYEKSLSKA